MMTEIPQLTLKCSRCGHEIAASANDWCCPVCGGPLDWLGPSGFSRERIDTAKPSLWRYSATLPFPFDPAVSLGESITPLVPATLGGRDVLLKLDYLHPTGSYKDRGAAVMIPALKRLGATHAVEDSSGNAAAAIAGYAARARLTSTIFAPAAASAGKLVQTEAFGATVVRVEGNRDDVARAAMTAAAETPGATYASHNWHPFFIEGVKTWALEVWEQLGFRTPDVMIAPVGSGSMILGAAKSFELLRAGGEVERLPRLAAAQPAACAPLHAAFTAGLDDVPGVTRQPTLAEGASIAKPVRGKELLQALRQTDGLTAAVSEEEIVAALLDLARQGFLAEPTSAVAAAGAKQLIARGEIAPNETIVVLLTGHGLKATETIRRLLDEQRA
jgi:threonine synthase